MQDSLFYLHKWLKNNNFSWLDTIYSEIYIIAAFDITKYIKP